MCEYTVHATKVYILQMVRSLPIDCVSSFKKCKLVLLWRWNENFLCHTWTSHGCEWHKVWLDQTGFRRLRVLVTAKDMFVCLFECLFGIKSIRPIGCFCSIDSDMQTRYAQVTQQTVSAWVMTAVEIQSSHLSDEVESDLYWWFWKQH